MPDAERRRGGEGLDAGSDIDFAAVEALEGSEEVSEELEKVQDEL